jgi:hypothetical protein
MEVKYLGISGIDQNCIHGKVRSRLSLSSPTFHQETGLKFIEQILSVFVWARNIAPHIKEQKLKIFDNVDLRDEVTGG